MDLGPQVQIASETTLSIIPSLIKMSPLSVPDLTLLRLVTVSALSLFGANLGALYALDISRWIIPSAITITHIVSSYLGFRLLPPVWSQVLFYSYPFFILIGSNLILSKSIRMFDILWFIPLLSSIYLLYTDENQTSKKVEHEEISTFDWTVGIVSLLVSAATEAAYFLYFLSYPLVGGWNRVAISYIGAAIIYTLYYIATNQYNKQKDTKKPANWLFAIVWNIVISGFGYFGRFWSQDKVAPILYSAISYVGLITGYIFSVLVGQDTVTKVDIVSLVGVLFSILGLTYTPILIG